MERLECLILESFKKKLNDNYLTVLDVMEDRVSYGVIIQDAVVNPYLLADLAKCQNVGIELIRYRGLERLCFYFLKNNF